MYHSLATVLFLFIAVRIPGIDVWMHQVKIIGDSTSRLKPFIKCHWMEKWKWQMSNWASLMHPNKSESEKTWKGGWFQYSIQMRRLSWLRQLRFLWHRELHFTPSVLHLHLFDWYLVWHEHLKRPSPPVLLCRRAASLTPSETLSGTSADERNFWVSNSNWFLENCVFSVLTLVPKVQRLVSSS